MKNGSIDEVREFCEQRAQTYRLFSSLIDCEVSSDTASLMSRMGGEIGALTASASEGERMIADGFSAMARSVNTFDRDVENDLACDFARIFLAAGTYEGQAAVPYESIYTSDDKLLMQDARDQVRTLFRAADVMPDVGEGMVPEDYLVFELEFMALLNERTVEAYAMADRGKAADLAGEAYDFFLHHIGNWVKDLLKDVDEVAQLPFYRGLACALRGFIMCEEEDTCTLVKVLSSECVA